MESSFRVCEWGFTEYGKHSLVIAYLTREGKKCTHACVCLKYFFKHPQKGSGGRSLGAWSGHRRVAVSVTCKRALAMAGPPVGRGKEGASAG